ncbi:hypothetical protein JCM10207_003916 [Rhodosporidiobolus poonsookiae]
MGDSSNDSQDTLDLTLRLATHPVHPSPSSHALTVPSDSTVGDLKQRLEQEWDGKPKKDGITVVKGGRVLRDAEKVGEVFDEERKADPPVPPVLHVIVRPAAWSAPFAAPPPAPAPAPPAVTVSSPDASAPSASPFVTNLPSSADADVLASPGPASALPSPGLVPPQGPPEITETPPTPVPTPPPQAAGEASANGNGYTPANPTTPPATSAAPGAAANPLSSPPTTAAPSVTGPSATNNPYVPYLSHLQRLVPLQRALLLLNLQKAHAHYAQRISQLEQTLAQDQGGDAESGGEGEEGAGELDEVNALLEGCGLWKLVDEAEGKAEGEYEERIVQAEAGVGVAGQEFQVVQIAGLPYLLHAPQALAPPSLPSFKHFLALRRAQAIYHILTTLLQLLLTLQPTAGSVAHGRAASGPGGVRPGYRPLGSAVPGGAAAVLAAQAAAAAGAGGIVPPGVAGPAVRRRATVTLQINLEAFVSLLIPLFLLSLKLGFLLWIFGRHASSTKRVILCVMAVAWVVWEGWGIQRRRVGQVREQQRGERERRRAARAAAVPPVPPQPQGQPGAQQAPPPPAQAGGAQPGAPAPVPPADAIAPAAAPAPAAAGPAPRRRSTPRRPPASRLSPKYWLNTIAAVGLVAEARELGLQPRFIAGRPIAPAGPPPRTPAERSREALRRAARNVLVGVVLFFGTLSPEVERKRKRALEKRERLLRERREAREREEAVRVVAAERATRTPRTAPSATPTLSPKPTTQPTASTSAVQISAPSSSSAAGPSRRLPRSPLAGPSSPPDSPPLSQQDVPRRTAGSFDNDDTIARKVERQEHAFRSLSATHGEMEVEGEGAIMDALRAEAQARRPASEREQAELVAESDEDGERAELRRAREEAAVRRIQQEQLEMLRREHEEDEAAEAARDRAEAAGRAKVSDEELFRDGGSDAYGYEPADSTTAAPASAATTPLATPAPGPAFEGADDPDMLDPLDDGDGGSTSGTDDGAGANEGEGGEGEEGAVGRRGEDEVDQVVALF